MKRNILVIDDDQKLQELLCDYLRDNSLVVESAFTGRDGVSAIRQKTGEPYDIIVLDIMLPDQDGFETLRQIRTLSPVPVIMLTARIDETDRIIGLEMGADDYMHKPFNPRELMARIKAVLRRSPEFVDQAAPEKSTAITVGPFVIDVLKGKVFKNGRDLSLSGVEFDIVRELAASSGRPVSRDHLLNIARGREFEAFDRSIDVHISRIRKKIEADPARPDYIKTVWGKGYSWGE